jgi:hypothetical protein
VIDASTHLRRVGDFLRRWDSVWRPRPFADEPLPWRDAHPELATWLDARTLDEVESLQEADLSSGVPTQLAEWAREARVVSQVPMLDRVTGGLEPAPGRPPRRVPGRKWLQVHAFGETVLHALGDPPARWVEWCSGKSHLGRALSRATGVPLIAIERDAALCDAGRAEVDDDDPEVRFVTADVHDPNTGLHLSRETAIVGLHACGDLTNALLRAGTEREVNFLAASPCCPHRTPSETYQPMSDAGRAADLKLNRGSLLLAVSGEVVGGARIRRMRRQAMVWRAAFSLLVGDTYRPLPSVRDSVLSGSFRDFAEAGAARERIALPSRWDEPTALAAGAEHVHRARARGLVRAPFRAALELWTVLDRAAWLQENGREARVGRFCPREVTPRNLAVISRRTQNHHVAASGRAGLQAHIQEGDAQGIRRLAHPHTVPDLDGRDHRPGGHVVVICEAVSSREDDDGRGEHRQEVRPPAAS